MNTNIRNLKRKCSYALILLFLSLTSLARHHVTMQLKNIRTTVSGIQYDLYVINDGGSQIQIAGCSFGVNIDQAACNGGSLTYACKPSGNDNFLNNRQYMLTTSEQTKQQQARMTSNCATIDKAIELLPNIPVKIGRFTLSNSVNWSTNGRSNLSLQETYLKEATTCYVLVFDEAKQLSVLSSEAGNLSIQTERCPVLNPSQPETAVLSGGANRGEHLLASIDSEVNIYPNPAVDLLHINYTATVQQNIQISIADVQGRTVYHTQSTVNQGANDIPIPIQSLVQGMYFLQLRDQYNLSVKHSFIKR